MHFDRGIRKNGKTHAKISDSVCNDLYSNDFVNGDQQPNIDNVEVTAFCLGVTSHFLQTMQKQSTVTSE